MNFPSLRFVFAVFLTALCALPAVAAPRKKAAAASGTYKGFVVMDATTGKFLAEENADEITPPASMTKLMTFAVLYDKLQSGSISLSSPVKITREDSKMGGTQVFLDERETFSVEELIYAMMIQSANDAAHALARFSAGSPETFVGLMNAKAREIGMTHTTFRSPHGLPPPTRRIADGDLTTPRDFALLCRYLLLKTDVLRYTSVQKRDFGPERAKGPMHMDNHNKLLGKVSGVDGLKTGYTVGAGYCLSATAQRNGQRVIVVIMGAIGAGGKVDLGRSRDLKAIELLERGFSALPAGNPLFSSVHPDADSPIKPVSAPAPVQPAPAPAGDDHSIKFTVPGK